MSWDIEINLKKLWNSTSNTSNIKGWNKKKKKKKKKKKPKSLRPIYNPTKKKIMKHNFQNNLILKDKIKKKHKIIF